jgi:hypothetical protein
VVNGGDRGARKRECTVCACVNSLGVCVHACLLTDMEIIFDSLDADKSGLVSMDEVSPDTLDGKLMYAFAHIDTIDCSDALTLLV